MLGGKTMARSIPRLVKLKLCARDGAVTNLLINVVLDRLEECLFGVRGREVHVQQPTKAQLL